MGFSMNFHQKKHRAIGVPHLRKSPESPGQPPTSGRSSPWACGLKQADRVPGLGWMETGMTGHI